MAAVQIIIPAYNEASRIEQTVAPLIDRYDVLVVDDGSTDDTAMAARDAGARVVEQIEKPRDVAWVHGRQFFYVLRYLLRGYGFRFLWYQ